MRATISGGKPAKIAGSNPMSPSEHESTAPTRAAKTGGRYPIMRPLGEQLHIRRQDRLEELKPDLQKVHIGRTVRVLIAMSFRDEEEPALTDYYQAMLRAAKETKLPLILKRIDLVEGDYENSQKIMNEITSSEIVIADFTMSPHNVYFELGFARGQKKHVIQTARANTDLQFDARNWRTHFYKNATDLEAKLAPALIEAYKQVAGE